MKMQYDEVAFFVGVVEDRMDPLQQGRVRVRVVGVHPFSRIQGEFSGIPVEDLPWMSTMGSNTSATVSGVSGAITGLLPGSSVIGLWLDKYKTNGIVLGPFSGNQVEIPNPEEGFSDPMGLYPNAAGPDTSGLNAGGAYGDASGANAEQNGNSSTGVFPGAGGITGNDDDPSFTLREMLIRDEGVKTVVYWVAGLPHIGVGHLILPIATRDMSAILKALSSHLGTQVGSTITQAQVNQLFERDLAKVHAEIRKNRYIAPAYALANKSRQMALENMCFQMGSGGLANFRTMLSLMAAGKYEEASVAAKQSLWAKQTPGRASKIAMIIKNGNLASYGIMPKKSGARVAAPTVTNSLVNNFDPFDPNDVEIYPDYESMKYTDNFYGTDLSVIVDDTPDGVLFVEPNSSYQSSYPYNQATVTEGGHSQEFDNTPGFERYRLRHPGGSYVEVAPDGRKTDKCMGDLYHLTEGDRNELTAGQRKVNVGGVETYINFADVIRQIEGSNKADIQGNNTITIKGNEVKKIEGSGTIEVGAGIKIIVTGDANIEVSGNTSLKTGGNLDANISGNWNVVAGGSYNVQCGTVTMNTGPVTWNTPRFDIP